MNQERITSIVTVQTDSNRFQKVINRYMECQDMRLRVAEYIEPTEAVQVVCNYLAKINIVQTLATELRA